MSVEVTCRDLETGETETAVVQDGDYNGRTVTTTIRLPRELHDAVRVIARAEGKSVSEVLREAIAAYIARRRADPEFVARLRRRIEQDQAMLKRMASS